MIKKWLIKKQDPQKQKILSEAISVSMVTAQLLINRGIDTPEKCHDFLRPSLLNLKDPFLMKDMRRSVNRIKRAIEKHEKILIHGDYDADGVCSTALAVLALKNMGADVSYYIPDRAQEGYGLNQKALKLAKDKNISLLITVDCGITAKEQIALLNSFGIDIIVTDHHQPGSELPNAYSILNPLQPECKYPYKDLAGVGIVFKLISALYGTDTDYVYEHLDLACLGTISDIAPLSGENRILVKSGLYQLQHTKKIGLESLLSVCKLKGKELSSFYVGYMLGPRINAAGRLGSANAALDMLLTNDSKKGDYLAEKLDTENKNRQKLEQQTLAQALAKIERYFDFKQNKVIVLHDDNWHQGVIGIVASRIVDKFYRPALVLTTKDSMMNGSGRSIKNFHLVDALNKCSHLLKNYGGHRYAAGMSLPKKHFDDFKNRINNIAHKQLSCEDLIPVINIDMEVGLKSLTDGFFKEMELLAPFGPGNREPIFFTKKLKLKNQHQAVGKNTLKMWVTDGETVCEAIGYGMADTFCSDAGAEIDLAYSCSLKERNGIKSILLQLKDFKKKESANLVA